MICAGEERHDDGHRVERDDHDEPGHDPGGHQIGDGLDAHHLEGVDLLADPHRAHFCGSAGADGGRQSLPRHHRRGDTHVDQRSEEPGERLNADVAQGREALNRDQ